MFVDFTTCWLVSLFVFDYINIITTANAVARRYCDISCLFVCLLVRIFSIYNWQIWIKFCGINFDIRQIRQILKLIWNRPKYRINFTCFSTRKTRAYLNIKQDYSDCCGCMIMKCLAWGGLCVRNSRILICSFTCTMRWVFFIRSCSNNSLGDMSNSVPHLCTDTWQSQRWIHRKKSIHVWQSYSRNKKVQYFYSQCT